MSDRYFISETDLRGLAADLLGAGTEVIAPVATDICQSPSAIAATACTLDHSLVDIDYRALATRRRARPQPRPAAALAQGLLPARARGALPLEAEGHDDRGRGSADRVRAARRAGRQGLRRRRPRGRRQGHELGLQGRALERPPRGDHHRQPHLPHDRRQLLLHRRRRRAGRRQGRRRPAHAGRRRLRVRAGDRQGARPGRGQQGALLRRRRGRHARPRGRRRARGRPRARRRQPRDRRAERPRLDRHALRGPAALAAGDPLQRLRRLHQRLPHLPLLRHRRRAGRGRPRDPAPLLGHLPGADLHAARQRPQPARRPARALPPAHQPQVRHLPAQVRRGALHRLRPLHARLPRRPGPRRDPAGDRHRRPPSGRRRRPGRREPAEAAS